MASPSQLMNLGMPALLALEVCGRVRDTLTATGTTQADALIAPSTINIVTTTASGTGVVLPTSVESQNMAVSNLGANALAVYPASGQTINGGSANASISVAAGKTAQFIARPGGGWIALVGA